MGTKTVPPPVRVTYVDINGTSCAHIVGMNPNPSLRPIVYCQGYRLDPPVAIIQAWTGLGPFPSYLWAHIAAGRECWVPWKGPCVGKDDEVVAGSTGTALNGIRDTINYLGGRVHLHGYSGGGLAAVIIACKNPEMVASVMLLNPAVDLLNVWKQFKLSSDPATEPIATLWTGEANPPEATFQSALEAEGKDVATLAAEFAPFANRSFIAGAMNDPWTYPFIRDFADNAGIPNYSRLWTAGGGHIGVVTQPEWDDIIPVQLAHRWEEA